MKHKKSTGTGSEQGRCSEWKKNRFLFLMLVPGLIVLFFNNYLPMAGIVMAFEKINFKKFAFFGEWVGLSNLKAFVASALKIKPVMGATPEGTIIQLDQARGINKALVKMVDKMAGDPGHQGKTLAITHCNCLERAEWVKELALSKGTFKDCFIVDTRGISSLYANDGGIIMVV